MRRAGLAFAAAFLSAGLAACASRPVLLDETVMPPYAALVAKDRALAHDDVRVPTGDPGEPRSTMNLRVVRSPQGASRPALVLQPGVLADHLTWRFLTGLLSERFDLVLVDPPGTLGSDSPDPRSLGPDGYSPGWLARRTLRALRAWLASEPADRRLVLVGHSLGGTVVLRILGDPSLRSEFGDVVSRIDRAVLLAPADVAIGQEQPGLARIVDLGDAEVALGAAAGLLRAEVEQAIVRSVVDPRRSAFQQEADRIVALLSCSATRHAAQAMIRRFAPTDCAGRPDWDAIEPLEAQYANVDVPVLILWGRRDETLPCAMGYKLERQIPGARLEIIERAKHSSHQERAPEAARRILSFVDGSPE